MDTATAKPVSWTQSIATYILWSAVFVVIAGVIVGKFSTTHPPMEMPTLFRTPDFVLTDQDGKPFSASNLRGKVYIADFIFTTCGSVCPTLSKEFARLQKQTPADVNLISFTVDAEHDTPPVLKSYAESYGADPMRWHFLTSTPETMAKTIRAMKMVSNAATDTAPIMHDEHFLLVDAEGNVRGVYNSSNSTSMKKLINEASMLSAIRKKHGI